jgi:hypothetical protein
MVTFVTLVGIVGTRCAAAQQAPSPPVHNGRIWYEKYCTPCHGTGGAPGEAVFVKNTQPIDLRTYVQRHGGKFPSGDWLMVVMAEPLHNPHTEVWERIRREDGGGTDSETVGRAKVRSIADYIVSVQAK